MNSVTTESINDLIALRDAGVPVTLTSHPGNASLYKLVLWSCGIPEHLWDVTCCKADANNWPMHRLVGGEAELLIDEALYLRVMRETHSENRFITAYQTTRSGMRLGRAHVRAAELCFPGSISSCSRLLLQEEKRLSEMFDYLARTKREEAFPRCITADGMLRPMAGNGIRTQDMASSFISLLRELDQLIFSDDPVVTKGGACYGGVMVPLATMLVQYWQTGQTARYDISGPDMINYATSKKHRDEVTAMLAHLRKWSTALVPETIEQRILPGTTARVGHLKDHPSEEAMGRKVLMMQNGSKMSRQEKELVWAAAKDDERVWPLRIRPHIDKYFSQHDLLAMGKEFVVDEVWKGIPFSEMQKALSWTNNLLRL